MRTRTWAVAALALALGGCGDKQGGSLSMDMLANEDMARPMACTATSGVTEKVVVQKLTVPTNANEYGWDLNGDGTPDNKLGDILKTLASFGGDSPQMLADNMVASGDAEFLLAVQADDLTTSACAATTLQMAEKTTPPKFDGTDVFTPDPTRKRGDFAGPIHLSSFESLDPATAAQPVEVTILIPLIIGQPPLVLPLTAARVSYTHGPSNWGNGRIQGAVKRSDFNAIVIPAVADLLTKIIAAGGQNGTTIGNIFDTGMCTNPDGSMAVEKDGKVDPCELATNPLVSDVLAPDVQLFDANGNYAPTPATGHADSLSLGVAFVAVKASF